jgi:hypothetical protein
MRFCMSSAVRQRWFPRLDLRGEAGILSNDIFASQT